MKTVCSRLLSFAVCVLFLWPIVSTAQQPVRILVGFAAGGGLDTATRYLVEEMRQQNPNQNIIVENKPGAGGLVAAEALARAQGDGLTLMMAPITVVAVHPFVFKKLSFDPLTDLLAVAPLGEFRYGLAVNDKVPSRNVAEFISWAKNRQGGTSFASLGTGSFAQLLGVLFNKTAGTNMVEVPYKGSAPGLLDLRGNQVQATFDTVASLAEQHKSGAIRLLAVTGNQRSPLLPDVPAFPESKLGLGDIEVSKFWYGVFAPKGTPPAQLEALNVAINAAVSSPQLKARLATLDITPTPKSVNEFVEQTRSDNRRWGKIISESGLKFE
jgi:tripartite-type tricarboxylate transporter receptor subunit TctC